MLLAGTIAMPMAAFAQMPAVAPAAPEPPEREQIEVEVQRAHEMAAAARADAERAVAEAQAQGQNLRVFAGDANGNPRVAYWAARGGKKEKAAYLGITASPADPALRDQLKLPRGIGLVIQTVWR
jgi:hypothetical protein